MRRQTLFIIYRAVPRIVLSLPIAVTDLAHSIRLTSVKLTLPALEELAALAKECDSPCLINHYTDEQAAQAATIENINRVDLDPIEEAKAYRN